MYIPILKFTFLSTEYKKNEIFFTDYTSGFGGKFGVQNDRVDKSAMGWDHIEKVEKHDSQKGMLDYILLLSPVGFECFLL